MEKEQLSEYSIRCPKCKGFIRVKLGRKTTVTNICIHCGVKIRFEWFVKLNPRNKKHEAQWRMVLIEGDKKNV